MLGDVTATVFYGIKQTFCHIQIAFMSSMVIQVVEFSREGGKIRKILPKNFDFMLPKQNY